MKMSGLISEDGQSVSIGRLTFWLLFCICLYYWLWLKAETPATLMDGWYAMVLYNFGKKGVDAFNSMNKLKHGGRNAE